MITNFFAKQIHLTIILRVRVRYEMVVGYNNLMSMQHAFFPTLFVKTTDFQLVFNFGQTRTVRVQHNWRAWYSGSYTMMAKPTSSRIALSNDLVFDKKQYRASYNLYNTITIDINILK